MNIESEIGGLFSLPSPCLTCDGKCKCPLLKIKGEVGIKKTRLDEMQRSHPRYITSREQVIDPETGTVLYDREQPIPYEDAVKYGVIKDVRSHGKARDRQRRHEQDRSIQSSENREG